jgi:hypothetical protein
LGAHICYPVGVWARFVTTAAPRLGRRLLGHSRLTDRLPLGAVRHAVLAVTESRVIVWEARIDGRGAELAGQLYSWPHAAVTLERKRHEIVTSWTDADGDSTSSRLKVLRYRFATPDGELAVDVPAGRGPAAELDRALVKTLRRQAPGSRR